MRFLSFFDPITQPTMCSWCDFLRTGGLSECKPRRGTRVQLQVWVIRICLFFREKRLLPQHWRWLCRSPWPSLWQWRWTSTLCVQIPRRQTLAKMSNLALLTFLYLGLLSFAERPHAGFIGDISCISDQVMLPDCIVFPRIPSMSKKASRSDRPCGSTLGGGCKRGKIKLGLL